MPATTNPGLGELLRHVTELVESGGFAARLTRAAIETAAKETARGR